MTMSLSVVRLYDTVHLSSFSRGTHSLCFSFAFLAGPGGSVIARRLAEDSSSNVLIIEAGGL